MALKTDFNTAKLEMVLVDPQKPETMALLKQAYQDIYLPAFPIADERENLQTIVDRSCTPSDEVQYVVIISGDNLKDPDKRVIHGMSVGGYFPLQQAGLMIYNAVAPEHRNEGLGKKMVEERIRALKGLAAAKGQSLQCVMLEVNDPEKVSSEDDSVDPKIRLKTFKSWGARIVPINYVLPPLEKGQQKCRSLFLMAYPIDGKYPDKKAVLGYVQSIYKMCIGLDYESDPDFKAIRKELLEWNGSFDIPAQVSVPKLPPQP